MLEAAFRSFSFTKVLLLFFLSVGESTLGIMGLTASAFMELLLFGLITSSE